MFAFAGIRFGGIGFGVVDDLSIEMLPCSRWRTTVHDGTFTVHRHLVTFATKVNQRYISIGATDICLGQRFWLGRCWQLTIGLCPADRTASGHLVCYLPCLRSCCGST